MVNEEVAVLGKVTEALEGLDESAAKRVVRWLMDRFNVGAEHVGRREELPHGRIGSAGKAVADVQFADFASLFAAARPQSGTRRALIGGFWLQAVLGAADFDSQSLNSELKNLGHGLVNVTRALSDLQNQRPQLVLQVKKQGRTAQARKRYRLTEAGLESVRAMLDEARS